MATRPRDRIVAIVIAILFFAFSFSLSFLVIWQLYKDHKEAKTVNNNPTSTQDTPASQDNKPLKGTKLANFTPVASVDKLQIIDLVPGDGQEVKAGDTITADYTGAVASSGTIFESSLDAGQPANFPLSGVIEGWQQGIPGMKVGGTRRLIIPANLAYGDNPRQGSGIQPGDALVFDVTLKSIGGQ